MASRTSEEEGLWLKKIHDSLTIEINRLVWRVP